MGYWRTRRAIAGRARRLAAGMRAGAVAPLSDGRILARLFSGEHLIVPDDDLSVAPPILAEGVWEPGFTRVFLSLLRPDSVVLDVGANVGYFAVLAAGTVVRGRIEAIEPNPRLARLITESALANNMHRRVTVHEVAVSDRSGPVVELTVPDGFLGGATTRGHDWPSSRVLVPTMTIDDLCAGAGIDRVDVIKMDIQGDEPEAYAGMRATVQRSERLALLVEFDGSAYADPAGFVDALVSDFDRVWWLEPRHGRRRRVRSVGDLPSVAFSDWVMLLAVRGRRR